MGTFDGLGTGVSSYADRGRGKRRAAYPSAYSKSHGA
jgi:hypothetical protein